MLQRSAYLDQAFHALADPSRRAIVERLSSGPTSVTGVAGPFEMSLSAVLQHVKVLEESGLIRTEKVGRVRTCRIDPEAMEAVERWVIERRTTWERRLDRLGTTLRTNKDKEKQ
jgi:DNA-binding transcriptional ArsR family regulator